MCKVNVAFDTDVSGMETASRTETIKQLLLHSEIKNVIEIFENMVIQKVKQLIDTTMVESILKFSHETNTTKCERS